MSTGKRLRFEILKRDGFRCRYCGATSISVPLHVDHVVPKSKGGTDDPENLVTACADCNSGKSNVGLDESRLQPATPVEELYEQAEQIRAYLAAQQSVSEARREVADMLADEWREATEDDPLLTLYNRFTTLAEQYPLDWLVNAMRAVGASEIAYPVDQVKYFYGCLRRMREREGDPRGS